MTIAKKAVVEGRVPKNKQKAWLREYTKMLVEKKEDITEIMGTPLSHFDYDRIKLELSEYYNINTTELTDFVESGK